MLFFVPFAWVSEAQKHDTRCSQRSKSPIGVLDHRSDSWIADTEMKTFSKCLMANEAVKGSPDLITSAYSETCSETRWTNRWKPQFRECGSVSYCRRGNLRLEWQLQWKAFLSAGTGMSGSARSIEHISCVASFPSAAIIGTGSSS